MASIKALLIMLMLGVIWCLRPFVLIRFGTLFVSRLGHLAGNTECYLCEKDAGINQPQKRTIDFWIPYGTPANPYLLKMYSRVMRIPRCQNMLHAMNSIAQNWRWWAEHTFNDSQWGRDIHNLMEKSPPHLKFTAAEEKRGQRELRELGIPAGAKWVCLIARDSYYLRATGADYSYHDFRDSDIQNYRETAVELTKRGYYVLRMGAEVAERMKLQAPMFIDYAMSAKRSDFMDVYLGAKCEFCITNGTGFDGIPMVFRRPLCFVNEAPFEYLSTWLPNSIAIWKHHVKDGKRMTPAEIVASGAGLFYQTQHYRDAGITLEENSSGEIRDAALEMADMVNRITIGYDILLQHKFWEAYPRSLSPHNGLPLHGTINLRIGSKFLDLNGRNAN